MSNKICKVIKYDCGGYSTIEINNEEIKDDEADGKTDE